MPLACVEVVEAGEYMHPCEGEMVCKLTNTMVRPAGLRRLVALSRVSACLHTLALSVPPLLSRPHLQIPYFNAPIFLENKTQVGKVDEILGQINSVVSSAAALSVLPVLRRDGRCMRSMWLLCTCPDWGQVLALRPGAWPGTHASRPPPRSCCLPHVPAASLPSDRPAAVLHRQDERRRGGHVIRQGRQVLH